MKTSHRWICSLATLVASLSGWAAETAQPTERTEVVFAHPDTYADVRDSSFGTDKGRDAILEQLKDYLVLRSKYYVAEGQKLTVTVTDVDLAGDFEPWRGAEMTDVRVVKDVYPPKVDLEFKLTGANGKVLKEGKRQLRDLAFLSKINIDRSDALRFEKALLDDWLRADFPRAK